MNVAIIAQDSDSTNKKQGEVIHFRKQTSSERFDHGHVQSSQLYRREVYPFLTDAARNVYFELESRINGFHKESDFVSYSQLQGTDLPGARKIGRATVARGVKELVQLGVITVLVECRRRGNKYKINEISLANNSSFLRSKKGGSESELVQKWNRTGSESEPPVVQNLNSQKIYKYISKDKKQKRDWLDLKILEEHVSQKTHSITLEQIQSACDLNYQKELFEEYNSKNDLAKNLKHAYFATWLLNAYSGFDKKPEGNNQIASTKQTSDSDKKNTDHHSSMKSENTRLDTKTEKTFSYEPKKTDSRNQNTAIRLTLNQIRMFASKLANHAPFASAHAEPGESLKDLENRLAIKLGNPSYAQEIIQDLEAVGYKSKAVGA